MVDKKENTSPEPTKVLETDSNLAMEEEATSQTQMETEDTTLKCSTRLIFWVGPLNTTWTFHSLDVDAMLLFTSLRCQESTLMVLGILLLLVITTVTPTKLVVISVQKWILWKLTNMLGTLLLTNVIHQIAMVTTTTAIKVVVVNLFGLLTQEPMDQVDNSELIPLDNSMSKWSSDKVVVTLTKLF